MAFDKIMQVAYQVENYDVDPDCVFRVAHRVCDRGRILPHGQGLREGDAYVELHIWNEHLAAVYGNHREPRVARKRRLAALLDFSMERLADYLAAHPEIKVVRGEISLLRPERYQDLIDHVGFQVEVMEPATPGAKLRQLLDNAYACLLTHAVNPFSHRREAQRMQRLELWLTRDTLLERYGSGG